MNNDNLAGNAQDLGGTVKSAVGDAIGDDKLKTEGMADQVAGKARAVFGDAKDLAAPAIEKVKTVARDKPWAAALTIGVVGLAIINTLRGRGKA